MMVAVVVVEKSKADSDDDFTSLTSTLSLLDSESSSETRDTISLLSSSDAPGSSELHVLFIELIQETSVWLTCREHTIQQLKIIADSLDKVKFDVDISQTVGSTVAVVGGVAAVVGGVMSLFTLGIAAPVAIAGISMSTVGSLTAAGASIAEHVISKEKTKEMCEIFKKDKASSEKLQEMSGKLSSYANNVMEKNPSLSEKDVMLKMIYNASKVTLSVAVNTARISEQVAGALGALTLSVGTKIFRGTNIVLGTVLIPFDVAQITMSGKSLKNGSKSEVSNEIRSSVKSLQAELDEGKLYLKVVKEELHGILNRGVV